ncbi:MAG: TadE/TadG family type IV pilus assembly protein [Planctomycetaceae bacterium]
MRRRFQNSATASEKRKGVAAVEFAMCIPLFVLLLIGAIQTTDAIYLRNSLRVTAYETVRTAVVVGSDNAKAMARANQILAARNVRNAVVVFDPPDITTAAPGQALTVTVSAPADSNTIMPQWFFSGKTISAKLIMSRE